MPPKLFFEVGGITELVQKLIRIIVAPKQLTKYQDSTFSGSLDTVLKRISNCYKAK